MTYELHALQRIRVKEEAAGAYGVDGSGTIGDYIDVPVIEGSAQLTLSRAQLPVNVVQQYIDAIEKNILGQRRCTLTFQTPLASHGVAATSIVASPGISTVALLRVLKAICGGVRSGNMGTATVAGSTATVLNVTAGHGARFVAGGAIAVYQATGYEMREIASISTDAITLKHALSGAPANGSPGLNASTIYLTEDPDTSLQFIVQGRGSDDAWVVCGLQGGLSMEITAGAIPMLTVTLEGVYWEWMSPAPTFAAATYSTFSPSAVIDSEFNWTPHGSAQQRNPLVAQAISFAPNIVYGNVTTPGGVENVERKRRMRAVPACTGSFTTPYEDVETFTLRDDRTDYAAAMQIGRSTSDGGGSMVLATNSRVQVTDVQRVDAEGIAGQQVSWAARRDTLAGEIGGSPLRFHFA